MLFCLDYDGVLVDSFDELLDLVRRAQVRVGSGRAPSAEDLRTIENLTLRDLAVHIGLVEGKIDTFMREAYTLQAEGWRVELFPGVREVLRVLCRTHVLVVITASHGGAVAAMLARSGVGDSITEVLGGESGMSKARRIELAGCRHGFARDATVMVGDAISDIRAGRLAGVKTAAVTWGYQPRALLLAETPDFVLECPRDLLRVARSPFAGRSW